MKKQPAAIKQKTIIEKPAVHFVPSELLNPYNPVIINLIGAGGTGSHVLTALTRLNLMLTELNHPGIMVRLFDDDRIERNNRLRMVLTTEEEGQYKSVVLINRINRFFGYNWKAVTAKYDKYTIANNRDLGMAEITISAVDTVAARFEIADLLSSAATSHYYRHYPAYWMDYGNSSDSGQVVLSTIGNLKQPESKKYQPVGMLPMVTTEFKDLLIESEQKDKKPGCSAADALQEQDLFINASLAYLGVELLKKMFREGMLFNRGLFHNLKAFRTQPIKVEAPKKQQTAA